MERRERGERVDADELIRAHPDLADDLRVHFAAAQFMDGALADLGPAPVPERVGPFRVERELGSGGMGRVFLAQSEDKVPGVEKGTRVAVKVVHPHLLHRSGFFRRFVLEAELGRKVRHENVVRTLFVDAAPGERGTDHFLVMEYVEGQTLRELADDLERVPEELCRHVAHEVARGLAAVHEAGIVHRDLKPENVLITADHVVKLMDLGVARLSDEVLRLSQTGAFVGSVHYAAPEQFKGDGAEVDGRADLHALGVVLYELASGTHPYLADEVPAVVNRVLHEEPRRLGEVNPQVSPFFEEMVHTLLAKERDERFASAAELAQLLEEAEASDWWADRRRAIRATTRAPLRRIRVPRETAVHGREEEIARLRALYEQAKAGEGQVALLEGEAGIGKTRLVDELVGRLRADGEDVSFLFASYPPGGAATASGAFSAAYREHLGELDLESEVARVLPQTPLLVPAFAALLRGDAAPAGAEKLTKDSLQTCFVHATRSLAAERTTIVLVDDLHFAPEEGRALFTSVALAAPGHRVLLLGTMRPGVPEDWTAGVTRLDHATHLPLPRLGGKDVAALLVDAFRSERLAAELGFRIIEKSDGNPFFVFEIIRGLREGQFLAQGPDGSWHTTRIVEEIQVPSSVLDLVNARVADLGDDERNLLDVAACWGFEFDPLLVAAALGLERVPALQTLGRVEKRHRLVRSAGRRYQFDHHQVQEALYGALAEPLRESYHAALADVLERRLGGNVTGDDAVALCEHLLAGAQGERALAYLGAALDHLEQGYQNNQAVVLADAALVVPGLVTNRERAELLLRKAQRLDILGRREAERAALDEARALADATGDPALCARSLDALGWHLTRVSNYSEAESSLRAALDLARAAGDKDEETAATLHLGVVFCDLGRHAEARELLERLLALARETGDRRGQANASGNLGSVFMGLGRYAEAREHFERSLALARETGDRRVQATATGNLGNIFSLLGRRAEAREHYERHLALARETGDRRGEAIALVNLGPAHLRLGETAPARRHLEDSLATCREIGARYVEGYALAGLSKVADAEGDTGAALARAEEWLALSRATGHGAAVANSLIAVAALLRRAGETESARGALEEALGLWRELGQAGEVAHALAMLACLPGGDAGAAVEAVAAEGGDADSTELWFLLWQATGDRAHLEAAKRLLDEALASTPAEFHDSMRRNVRLNREILEAWHLDLDDEGECSARGP